MKRYEIILAMDVACYKSVIVEADTPEAAASQALTQEMDDDEPFEPAWDCASEVRIVDTPIELPEVL